VQRPGRFVPSPRSVAIGFAIAAGAGLLYLAARETPVFAVRTVEVEGVPPALAHKVQVALQPLEGRSLLKLRGSEVTELATALPQVAGVSYDRAFPNTLRVHVVSEQPLAVVRRGGDSWLVSTTGRVTAKVARGTNRALPRIWLPGTADVTLGGTLPAGSGAEQVAALVPARAAGLRSVAAVTVATDGQLTYVLRDGVHVRAGAPELLPLKLTIARRILAAAPVAGYLDVSVPERPVALSDSQFSTGG
jgi:cell division protein FtsQ